MRSAKGGARSPSVFSESSAEEFALYLEDRRESLKDFKQDVDIINSLCKNSVNGKCLKAFVSLGNSGRFPKRRPRDHWRKEKHCN